MEVYIVSTGEYSDYRIHSAWSTKELAEKMTRILDLQPYNYAQINIFHVDIEAREKEGVEVVIDFATGEMMSVYYGVKYPHQSMCITPSVDFHANLKFLNKNNRREYYNKPVILADHFTLEQALKSAYDLRAKKQAEQAGI